MRVRQRTQRAPRMPAREYVPRAPHCSVAIAQRQRADVHAHDGGSHLCSVATTSRTAAASGMRDAAERRHRPSGARAPLKYGTGHGVATSSRESIGCCIAVGRPESPTESEYLGSRQGHAEACTPRTVRRRRWPVPHNSTQPHKGRRVHGTPRATNRFVARACAPAASVAQKVTAAFEARVRPPLTPAAAPAAPCARRPAPLRGPRARSASACAVGGRRRHAPRTCTPPAAVRPCTPRTCHDLTTHRLHCLVRIHVHAAHERDEHARQRKVLGGRRARRGRRDTAAAPGAHRAERCPQSGGERVEHLSSSTMRMSSLPAVRANPASARLCSSSRHSLVCRAVSVTS